MSTYNLNSTIIIERLLRHANSFRRNSEIDAFWSGFVAIVLLVAN